MEMKALPTHDDMRAALKDVMEKMTGLTIAVNNLQAMLDPSADHLDVEDFDPEDEAIKGPDKKLTERGIEICYRLFDLGENRNRVASRMKISFTAATHRYESWQKLGGPQRTKQPLD
jgi:hypothetical protein